MSVLALQPARPGARHGRALARARSTARSTAMPRYDDGDPCGGERVLDFAICLILAAGVVGLLLLAL